MCVCVCVCVVYTCDVTMYAYLNCSDGGVCEEVAQAVQNRLDSYKADKRDLGSVSRPNVCE